MFGLSFLNPWKWGTIGAAIGLAIAFGWAMRLDHLRASWEAKYTLLDAQAQAVLMAARASSANPKLAWNEVPAQITALGSSNLALKVAIDTNNANIEKMNSETLRLKAVGDLLRQNLVGAQKNRDAAMLKLDGMAKGPGARAACPALISQTQDAQDITWGSGL